ncbi:MAG: ribosome maturation factor RimP [Acaryochloridaceae cyanobacterium RL_2_7]|nr:ribosome maturation factor RimP [Acaryochloridaceae cyanobacterium RL_2_7]
MTHPLINKLIPLAQPIAKELGLEILDAVFQTNQSPPVLRFDVRNVTADTGLEDCEKLSRELDALLEQSHLIPDAYVLEVSSPGLSDILTEDRDFVTFRGFPVLVHTQEPYKKSQEWTGLLVERNEKALKLNLKGRMVSIPLELIDWVKLHTQE